MGRFRRNEKAGAGGRGVSVRITTSWFTNPATLLMKGRKLIVVGAVLVVAVGVLVLFALSAPLNQRIQSMQCGNQMSSIGYAARLWASETGNYPRDFQSLSNEIIALSILHCPSDIARPILHSWVEVTPENISYEVLAPGMSQTNTSGVFFRCRVHGHSGYGDGTVFDGKRRRTKVLF